MKFTLAAVSSVVLAATCSAVPVRRGVTDTEIMQFALTLEHLENAFYTEALNKYDEAAFEKAGFPSYVRGRFVELAQHEQQHVALLTKALGSNAVAACEYSFPDTDPVSFAKLSGIFEGVGASAYLGASPLISNPNNLRIAGSILTTEARQNAWVLSVALHAQPWSGPYETALDMNQAFTLASPFIKSCPSSNPKLPLKAFPTLNASVANAPAGTSVTYTWPGSNSGTYYAVYYSGITVIPVKLENGKATVPAGLQGRYYTVISTASSGVDDSNTVAGPLLSVANFGSSAPNYGSNDTDL